MPGPGEALRRALVTLAALAPIAAGAQSSSVHQLKPTPSTVAWGYYGATTPPVLRIKSGDTVEIHTLITSSPTRLGDGRRRAGPDREGAPGHPRPG